VEHLVAMPDMSAWTSSFALPSASLFTRPDVWGVAVTLAIVASIESLLNVEAIDKLDPFGRRSPMNRELIAQGLGNITSGLLGGLPVTSVVVRSSAALQAGARTRMASFSHGVLILVALVVLGPILQRIPLAALAALLILTGYKLAGPKVLARAWKEGPDHFIPFAATLIGVVGLDLLKGVCLGVVVAVILSLRKPLGRATVERRSESDLTIKLEKNVPFFARARIQAALDAVPADGRVVVDAEQATSVHRDVRETMKTFVDGAEKRSIAVEVRGLAVV
jgi:MFS superfamily sulfate permease-like transporter